MQATLPTRIASIDGRARPHAHLHGREAPEALAEFGESPVSRAGAKPSKILDARWIPGIDLGRALNARRTSRAQVSE